MPMTSPVERSVFQKIAMHEDQSVDTGNGLTPGAYYFESSNLPWKSLCLIRIEIDSYGQLTGSAVQVSEQLKPIFYILNSGGEVDKYEMTLATRGELSPESLRKLSGDLTFLEHDFEKIGQTIISTTPANTKSVVIGHVLETRDDQNPLPVLPQGLGLTLIPYGNVRAGLLCIDEKLDEEHLVHLTKVQFDFLRVLLTKGDLKTGEVDAERFSMFVNKASPVHQLRGILNPLGFEIDSLVDTVTETSTRDRRHGSIVTAYKLRRLDNNS